MSVRGYGGVIRSNANNLPPAATVTGARNGLTLSGTFVELGGANKLIHNTLVDTDLFRFLLGDNDSFLHVDAVAKLVEIGDFFSAGNGMIITVDNTVNRKILAQGGAIALDLLSLDLANKVFAIGDISNGTALTIDNTNFFVNIDIGSNTFFSLDTVNKIYAMGDLGNTNKGTNIGVYDIGTQILMTYGLTNRRMFNAIGGATGFYQMGDIDTANNGSFFSIDDQAGSISYTFTAAGGRRLLLDVTNGLYQIGDIDAGAGNESYILINDVTQQIFWKDGTLAAAANGYVWALADQTTGRGGWVNYGTGPFLPLAGGTMTGAILFSLTNTIDIGAAAGTKPRTGFFGTSVNVGNTGSPGVLSFNRSSDGATLGVITQNASTLIVTNPGGGFQSSVQFLAALNGVASTPALIIPGTWFTGGSATTTKPQLLLEPTGTTSNAWNVNGTGLGINSAAGFTGNLLDLQVAAVSKFSVQNGGSVIAASSIFSGAGAAFSWTGRAAMLSPSDGIIELTNQALTDFTRLQLGGTTNAFPSIKRNGTALNIRLADDSADAPLTASNITGSGNIIASGATSVIRLKGYTVATLPAGTQGDTAFVTDALAPAYLVAIVGGGAVVAPVFFNGTAWVAG